MNYLLTRGNGQDVNGGGAGQLGNGQLGTAV